VYLCVYTDDSATVTVDPTSGLNTTEEGGTAVFSVTLDSQPSSSVTMTTTVDTNEGRLSASALTFGIDQWNIPQTVTVTGVDDVWVDGDIPHDISISYMRTYDSNFHGVSVADVGVTNADGTTY
jgi:hypothetical protein